MTDLLTADYLLANGFEMSRRWDETLQQFRLYFEAPGYDCTLLISPHPQVPRRGERSTLEPGEPVGALQSPAAQVEELSDMELLKSHHTGDWQVGVNSLQNHVATFHYAEQVALFQALCAPDWEPQAKQPPAATIE